MSTANHFQRILEKLSISDNERAVYTKEAEEIQNYVVDELKRVDKTFRQVFDGLSLGGKLFNFKYLHIFYIYSTYISI